MTANNVCRYGRALCSIAAVCAWTATAHAEASARSTPPRVLVIAAQTEAGSPEAAITEAVRDALAELDEVELLPPSPLDLESVQLAIDCTGESAQCLSEIATRMDAQIVLVPSLKKRRDALEVHVTCFQKSADQPLTTAMRRQTGTRLDATLLGAVPGMLHEVLQLESSGEEGPAPEPIEEVAPLPVEPERTSEAEGTRADSSSFALPLGPVLLGAGGLALVAAGIVVGAAASSTEDDYASRTVETAEQAQRADALRVSGEREALAANILLGAGASAIIGAGIWYVLDARADGEPARASLRPALGPSHAGLLFSGTWGSQP